MQIKDRIDQNYLRNILLRISNLLEKEKKLLVNTLPRYWRRDIGVEKHWKNISCTVILSRDVINIKQTFHQRFSNERNCISRLHLSRKCERVKSWSARLLANGTFPEQLLSSANHCQNTIFHVRLLWANSFDFYPKGCVYILKRNFHRAWPKKRGDFSENIFWKCGMKLAWNEIKQLSI